MPAAVLTPVQSLLAALPGALPVVSGPSLHIETLDAWAPTTSGPMRVCWVCWVDADDAADAAALEAEAA